MSPFNPSAIVDAVMADLKAVPALSPTTTISYAEPTMPGAASCPLLAVWCEHTGYELLSNSPAVYERSHEISIAWYVSDPNGAEFGGVTDPATVQALDAIVDIIVNQVETYTSGVPGLDSAQQITTLKSRALSPEEGALWRGLVEIVVEDAA